MEAGTENYDSVSRENGPGSVNICMPPGTPQPLQPLSSERQNQQRVPQSPSVSINLDGSDSPRKSQQHRLSDASDVKARIAYLNSIAHAGSPTRSTSPTKPSMLNSNHAAIQRAVLGREEAEAALAALTLQLESQRARERLVSERVESLMEQLNDARNRQRHERSVYEKEIKQSRKTEYKAELAVIKLQEELREARSELEGVRARLENEKAEKEKVKQEAFERAYVISGMTEEVQDLKRKLEIAEQERDAAVAVAASKMPWEEAKAIHKEAKDDKEVGEKRKKPVSDFNVMCFDEMDLEDTDCPVEIKLAALKNETDFLRRQVQEGQETIHFMNMQCQFKACPCRLAERDGVRFVHDYEYDAKLRARNSKKRKVEELQPPLPLPKFSSWTQKREASKGKKAVRTDQEISESREEPLSILQDQTKIEATSVQPDSVVEEPVAPLPPADVSEDLLEENQQVSAIVEDAANVPLPSLKPMEIDPSDDTPEPTAQLEELTQLIVEPGESAKNFFFSTSVTSNGPPHEAIPTLRQSHNVRMSNDLFDISPPKRQMPPRPSTALGVLTVESPIRLVPHSPQVFQQRSLTPDVNLPRQITTRVALNDTSPVRRSRQQRQQQQPQAPTKDHSRGRSPATIERINLDRSSPAPSTIFPITPAIKNDRSLRQQAQSQPRPQTSQDHYAGAAPTREVSTTTTVPLRDDEQSATDMALDQPYQTSVASGTPFSVPGTPNMTREQALAQIRARRDRARSINMRKTAEEGSKTPGSAARRGVNLKEKLGDAKGRDFSQASAPGRI